MYVDPEVEAVVDEEEAATQEDSGPVYRLGQFIGMLIAIPLLVVFAVLVAAFIGLIVGGIFMLGWAVYHADPGELTPKDNAGYLDLIVSNRWVVWGLRGGLLVGLATIAILSLFVVMSIVVRARRGEWLRSGAGLQTDIQAAERNIERADAVLVSLLSEAQREKDELAKELADTTDLLDWCLSNRRKGQRSQQPMNLEARRQWEHTS